MVRQTPPRVSSVDAAVIGVARPCRDHVRIELRVDAFPASKPGQFLQLRCAEPGEDREDPLNWGSDGRLASQPHRLLERAAFLRRPFSIADRDSDAAGERLAVISRAVGLGTRWLDRLQVGATLNISGPFGRAFTVPEHDAPLILVGGGIGIPPMLYFARDLYDRRRDNVIMIFGALRRDLLPIPLLSEPASDGMPTPCVALPGDARFAATVTTDDGSAGLRGLVTDALAKVLSSDETRRRARVYACGPEGMLRAVAQLSRALSVECQLCIERTMGCGFGTCLSCVTRARDSTRTEGWRWVLACSDGPVFDRDALLDY